MRILVISDTHGRLNHLRGVGEQGPFDRLIHAGDFLSDLPGCAALAGVATAACHGVVGNCDYPDLQPLETVLEADGARILLTHGHRLDVKRTYQRIFYRAQELKCRVAIFGHTHVPIIQDQGGVLLFNPGSASFPRAGEPASCGLLHVEAGQVRAGHLWLGHR